MGKIIDIRSQSGSGSQNSSNGNKSNPPPFNWTFVNLDDLSISYAGNWTPLPEQIIQNNMPSNFPAKVASSNNCTVEIVFNGTQIAVIGPPGSVDIGANYSIDGSAHVTNTLSPNSSASNSGILFESSPSEYKNHKLVVDGLTMGEGHKYTLWSFFVNQELEASPYSQEENKDNGGSQSSKSHTNINTGAVIGAILGCLIFIVVLLLIIIYVTRRRQRARVEQFKSRRMIDYTGERGMIDSVRYTKNSDAIMDPGSVIDTGTNFTFAGPREIPTASRQSWVPVSLPPTVPHSMFSDNFRFSDWSSYKGSSVVAESPRKFAHPQEESRFSPYTLSAYSPASYKAVSDPPSQSSNKDALFQVNPALASGRSAPTTTSTKSIGRGRAF